MLRLEKHPPESRCLFQLSYLNTVRDRYCLLFVHFVISYFDMH